jgi:formylglycine-generating enzyme required for sulfatase activity
MDHQPIEPDLETVRNLLSAAFTPKDLRRFCLERSVFRPIVDLFGPDPSLRDMVDEVIDYCRVRLLWPELLAAVRTENPRQYARFAPDLPAVDEIAAQVLGQPSKKKPAPSTPEPALSASDRDTLTISRPISLLLVRVPAGEFLMGSVVARDRDAKDRELPPHTVHVPDFYIGKYPVTNLQYEAFVQATGHRAPDYWRGTIPAGKENHPVVYVTWHDALAFCVWLGREAGQPFRLPTEAEWEKAARGTDGRIYPWGDEPPDKGRCNFGETVGDTTAIGRYSPQGDSPYGCADMAGNVWEWCQSLRGPYPYQADDGREDLEADSRRVLRGGSWRSSAPYVRCAYRYARDPYIGLDLNGFRVARGPLR